MISFAGGEGGAGEAGFLPGVGSVAWVSGDGSGFFYSSFPSPTDYLRKGRKYSHKANNFSAYKGLGPNNSSDKMEARCNLLLSENLKAI